MARSPHRNWHEHRLGRAHAEIVSPVDPLLQLELPCDPASGRVARQALQALSGTGLRREELADLLLLATELVTNAIRHGIGGAATLEVTRGSSGLRVCVSNDGDLTVPAPKAGGPDGGWGLQLVEALSGEWGRSSQHGRTSAWFELQCARTHPAPASG